MKEDENNLYKDNALLDTFDKKNSINEDTEEKKKYFRKCRRYR